MSRSVPSCPGVSADPSSIELHSHCAASSSSSFSSCAPTCLCPFHMTGALSLSFLSSPSSFLSLSHVVSLSLPEPEGVFPPEVVTLNSTAVRVLWAEPLVPNGAITQYAVYVDDQLRGTVGNSTGSLELGDLLPFTVYDIQVCRSHCVCPQNLDFGSHGPYSGL